MQLRKKTSYKTGVEAEEKCKKLLENKGFEIVAERFKVYGVGEIDLIAKKENLIVFVEVKRRGSIAKALESVSLRQQSRIINTAGMFLAEHEEYANYDIRFDVIAVTDGTVEHLENAFGAV